jgi:hypothetical protein
VTIAPSSIRVSHVCSPISLLCPLR